LFPIIRILIVFSVVLFASNQDVKDWALIIGIDDYTHITSLDYAVNDAESINNLLIDDFSFSAANIELLTDENATYTNIRRSISNILKNAGEGDRVLIFFAGHGETVSVPGGGEMGYIIPIDGNPNDLYYSAIPMSEFKQISSLSPAKHVLFLVDACYGGLALNRTRSLSKSNNKSLFINKLHYEKSRRIITAGRKGEQVIEKSEWGHSAFTMNLLKGLKDFLADLNNDGYITGDELGLFLKDRVSIDSENQQTPSVGKFTSDEGEYIFSHNKIYNDINNDRDKRVSSIIDQKVADMEKQILINNRLIEYNSFKREVVKRSIIFPGLGHHYAGNKKEGYLWQTAEIISLTGLVSSIYNYIDNTKKANDALIAYNRATDNFGLLYQTWENAELDKYNSNNGIVVSGSISTLIWIANIISIKNNEFDNINISFSQKQIKTLPEFEVRYFF